MDESYILSIDQGTSSTKTIIFDSELNGIARVSEPLKSEFLKGGLVEQDPEEIYKTVLSSVDKCLQEYRSMGLDLKHIKTCGLTNQRETFVVWDGKGKPLYNAVVWQCKRSIDICNRLKMEGLNETIQSKTGLLIDPYFSGTKLLWLYENIESIRNTIDKGQAYFGTIDTWLLYKLTRGKSYQTDYTNASRTLLFNLHTLSWDNELLNRFGFSNLNLPEPRPSSFTFGQTDFEGLLNASLTIDSMIGDSHAAAVGEGCFTPGTAKATMGTGSSIIMNVGNEIKESTQGMVSTICWSMEGRVDYAVEGVIVSCGSIIEWLKNQLGLFIESSETEKMAKSVSDNGGVYLIPAFSGLGAPFWKMDLKASIHGLTFESNKNHLVRAALESISFQIKEVILAMEQDSDIALTRLMVNGGLVSNRFLLQQTADLLSKLIAYKNIPDVTSQGAACLAGLKSGIFKDVDQLLAITSHHNEIPPDSTNESVNENYSTWRSIVKKEL